MVSITNPNGVTFTFQEGNVETVKSSIRSEVEQCGMSGLGSSGSYLSDYDGVTKNIMIEGYLTQSDSSRTDVGSVKTILEQKKWLECLQTGLQELSTFSSTFESQSFNGTDWDNTTVMINLVEFTEVAGDVNRLKFTMTLLVGGL